ncbi:Leucine Rich Repeat family protein [Trichomonas vaginalis G3]|uniref:Leucine Rich Repeat family protein n=1 Tax=Trichomonas vaginalis (strain ATCC PRA-98 / G3) TaxID=412133 RepID=A2ES08_TRIV3|nr:uncharacterized protein TVAGG3_0486960 [Trichomonas vaginalis G3]EAY04603.1 Leucine Rich Repeat family protein [Trichomonas vaginalis G3]KAI5516103.1 leucine-rich repeat, isoform f-related family [Trichomonas vaginalis G3]|eukprot:XP_001316826.1 hypothetical protein [Trichomonas vaginalis G3]
MNEILPRIQSGARSRGENIRYICQARDLSNQNSIIDVYISISDTHFDIYKETPSFSVNAYSWFSLKRIFFKDDVLNIDFSDAKISLSFDDLEKVYNIVSDILPRILKPSEIQNTGVNLLLQDAKPNPNSALLRLKQKIKYSKNPQNSEPIDIITEYVTFNPHEVELSKLSSKESVIPYFIDIIPLLPCLQSLIISTSFLTSNWKSMSNFVNDTGFVEHIEIVDPINEQVEKFLTNLFSNKHSFINSLSFKKAALSEKNLTKLQSLMKTKQLSSLSIISSLDMKSLPYFHMNFINDLSSLLYLNLDTTPGLNLFALLPKITNITYLSLSGCELDIGRALTKFTNLNFHNLTGLNLSNNSFEEILPQNYIFPPKLSKIMLDDAKFGDQCFQSLFSAIKSASDRQFKVSISHYTANKIDEYINTLESTNIQSLVWDKNPITKEFISFLKRNKSIEFLSVSGCFVPNSDDFKPFCEYLIENSTIKSLVFRENQILSTKITDFIDILSKRPESFEFLDISNSKCGDQGINEITKFISTEKAPHVFVIDGAAPNKSTAVLSLLNTALELQNDVCVSYPVDDMNYLTKLKRMTEQQHQEILSKYRSKEGTEDNVFDSPFSVFVEKSSLKFPKFISTIEVHSQHQQNVTAPISPHQRKFFSNPVDKQAKVSRFIAVSPPSLSAPQSSSSASPSDAPISNVPAVSSQASRSVASSIKDEKEKKPPKPIKTTRKPAPAGKVSRLTPSASLSKLLNHQKREPLQKHSSEKDKQSTDQNKNEKNSVSHSSSLPQSPLNTPQRQDVKPFNESSNSESIKNSESNKNSDSNKISGSNKEESKKNSGSNQNLEQERKRRRRHHSNRIKDGDEWKFPIPRVEIADRWGETEKRFSLEEVDLFLRQLPHL